MILHWARLLESSVDKMEEALSITGLGRLLWCVNPSKCKLHYSAVFVLEANLKIQTFWLNLDMGSKPLLSFYCQSVGLLSLVVTEKKIFTRFGE